VRWSRPACFARLNLDAAFPGAVDQLDQLAHLPFGLLAIYQVAGGDFIRVIHDGVLTLLPAQRGGGWVVIRPLQDRVQVGQYRRDVNLQANPGREARSPGITGWREDFYVVALDEFNRNPPSRQNYILDDDQGSHAKQHPAEE